MSPELGEELLGVPGLIGGVSAVTPPDPAFPPAGEGLDV